MRAAGGGKQRSLNVLALVGLLACGHGDDVDRRSEPRLTSSGDERQLLSILSGSVHGMDGPDAVVEAQESLSGIEARGLAAVEGCEGFPKVPFGFAHGEWLSFREQVREGEVMVHYRSGQRFWRNLAGSEGYALIRGDTVIAVFTVAVS